MLVKTMKNEEGFVLIASLMMLVILMVIGIAATTTTTVELQISGNDKAQKRAFYFAEDGNEVGKELVEVAIEERGWLSESGQTMTIGKVDVLKKGFFLSNRDIVANGHYPDPSTSTYIDATVDFGAGTTGLLFDVNTVLSSGGALQMISGYEGKGKGSASSGAWAIYDIRSQHDGPNNSQARVWSQWLHLL